MKMRGAVRRKTGFVRILAIPTLAGLGTLLLGFGHKMSADASMAAQLPPAANVAGGGAVASGSANPEFGAATSSVPSDPDRIPSTSVQELIREARANSGREDPFVALTLPEAFHIVPLPPPPIKPVWTPPPPPPRSTVKKLVGNRWITVPVVEHRSPQWNVQGILNTGEDQLVLLVDNDNNTVPARVGDVLPDGSRVVSISPQQVTLEFQGQRFVKTIGGPVSP